MVREQTSVEGSTGPGTRVIDLGRVLTPQVVEEKLRGIRPYLKTQTWNPTVVGTGMQLDLSRVEWADIAGMARICLLVEGALRHGIECRVALPNPRRSRGERRWLDSLASDPRLQMFQGRHIDARVNARGRALRFMRHCQFPAALEPDHVPGVDGLVRVAVGHDTPDSPTPAADPSLGVGGVADDLVVSRTAGTRTSRVFELQWLTAEMDAKSIRAWEEEAVRRMAVREAALSRTDAEAVVGVVLRELIANVHQHAKVGEQGALCPPAALVGAVAVRGSRITGVGERRSTAKYSRWVDETGAPVLRLVVGDSGSGICTTLGLPDEDHPPESPPDRDWTENERLLFWSLTPFSSRYSGREPRPGARGLSSVRGAVGDGCGALILRSADAETGFVYPRRKRESLETRPPHLAWTPGTFVDIALAPTAEPRAILGPVTGEDRLRVAAVVPLRRSPKGPVDVDGIRGAFPRAPSNPNELVVVVGSLRGSRKERLDDAKTLVELNSDLSDHGKLVLLSLGEVSTKLAPALTELHQMGVHTGNYAGPIMVLDARGSAHWLGIPESSGRLLDAITGPDARRIARDDAQLLLDVDPASVGDELARLGGWIAEDSKGIGLRITPAAVASALRDAVSRTLQDVERAASVGAEPGARLVTPTLATVSRWINMEQLVEQGGGAALLGHVLGVELARTLTAGGGLSADPERSGDGLAVVCVGGVPSELENAFRAALGAGGRTIHLRGEAGRHDDPSAPFVVARSRFVCLTDAVVTSNHARHAVHDLIRAGAEPLAVAAVVDARAAVEPLTALGRELPVQALARIPLVEADDRAPTGSITPVAYERATTGRQPRPSVGIDELAMVECCEAVPDSVITGHVARVTRRHFTTYLDVERLLGDDAFRKGATGHIRKALGEWLAAGPQLERLVLTHPQGDSVAAESFATLTRQAWRGESPEIEEIIPLPQVTHDGRRVLDVPAVCLEAGTGVVVCNWGAVTLHTLNDLIHAAAELGATRVLALVLSSQLSAEDEYIATRLGAIRGRPPRQRVAPGETPPMDEPRDGHDRDLTVAVPVETRFISRFGVGYASPGECAACRRVEEYMELAVREPVPLLARHARKMAEELEPAELRTEGGESPRDALGHSLSHAEAVALIRFRQQVSMARAETVSRFELRERIDSMSADDLDAAVRLLALESQWLKLPPLRFTSLRAALAARLEARLAEPDFMAYPTSLRRQYILILRATEKSRFLACVPQLLPAALRASDALTVAAQVLDGVQSLARRPYRTVADLRRVSRELSLAADAINGDRVLAATPEAFEVQQAISTLRANVEYQWRVVEHGEMTPQEAWLGLRVDFWGPVTRHEAEFNAATLEGQVRGKPPMLSSEEWRDMLGIWRGVQKKLVEDVLPRLRLVSGVVTAFVYHSQGEQVARRAERVAGDDVVEDLDEVERILTGFVRDPESAARRLDEFAEHIGFWHQFFFAEERNGLLDALRQCPCALGAAVIHALDVEDEGGSAERKLRPVQISRAVPSPDVEVFAHRFAIAEVVHHAVLNARQMKHADPAASVNDPVELHIEVFAEASHGVVRVRNEGTQRSEPPGAGLAKLERLVRGYGGSIEPASGEGDWTFELTARFPRWKEHE